MLHGPFFAGLSNDALDAVERAGSIRSFEAGETLFREGDQPQQLMVILEGEVRIWRCSPNGAAMTVHIMEQGDIPGCVAVFKQIAYPATATALTTGRAAAWPAEEVPRLLAEHPLLATNAIKIVGTRNQEMLQRLHEVSTIGVEQRVARALLRLSEARKTEGDAEPVEVPLSRQALAELSATTLHTVSRLVSGWQSEGIVSGGRGRIAVLDPSALLERATRGAGGLPYLRSIK
jgi:CRP-like cAMP-binding protein